jgi:hypothetical protein
MWGPLFAWCALELLAESIDPENPERVALDLFDRLRLREPFAHAFDALGFEDEAGWRAAARIKVVLLAGAGVGEQEPAEAETAAISGLVDVEVEGVATAGASAKDESTLPLPVRAVEIESVEERIALAPELWLDADVRWLTGVHEAEGHLYLVREPYEELLWWLLMPALLRLAGEDAPGRAAAEKMRKTVEEALATAAAANYRLGVLLNREEAGPAEAVDTAPRDAATSETIEVEPGTARIDEPLGNSHMAEETSKATN